jgi:hypothetical protein
VYTNTGPDENCKYNKPECLGMGQITVCCCNPAVLPLYCCKLASMLQTVAIGRRQTPAAAQVTSRASVLFGDEQLHKRLLIWLCTWAGMAQSVQQLARDCTVRGSDLGGGEIFHTRPHRPWGPPSLLYNGYRVFPGVKAAGGGGVALTTHFHLAPRLKKK